MFSCVNFIITYPRLRSKSTVNSKGLILVFGLYNVFLLPYAIIFEQTLSLVYCAVYLGQL